MKETEDIEGRREGVFMTGSTLNGLGLEETGGEGGRFSPLRETRAGWFAV